jgi:hypothetical protein
VHAGLQCCGWRLVSALMRNTRDAAAACAAEQVENANIQANVHSLQSFSRRNMAFAEHIIISSTHRLPL